MEEEAISVSTKDSEVQIASSDQPEQALPKDESMNVDGEDDGEIASGRKSKKKRKTCAFFIPKKKRYCNLPPQEPSAYCSEHRACSVTGEKKRVYCPLDPRHTVYETDLSLHLKKKCPQLKVIRQPFYKQDINSGDEAPISVQATIQAALTAAKIATPATVTTPVPGEDQPLPPLLKNTKRDGLKTLTKDQLTSLLQKIEKAYQSVAPSFNIPPSFYQNEPCKQYFLARSKCKDDEEAIGKHETQYVSLVGNIQQAGLIGQFTYIEFGAGSAGLSTVLASIIEEQSSHILIDRKAVRDKADRWEKTNIHKKFDRVGIDICHLYLDGLPQLATPNKLVAVSKHLCGCATDLTLRCLTNTLNSTAPTPPTTSTSEQPTPSTSTGSSEKTTLEGIVIALCCHHGCAWKSYVNRNFWQDLGFTQTEFDLLCNITSWGVSGAHGHKPSKTNNDTNTAGGDNTIGSDHLTQPQRQDIGLKCKRLLDMGRVMFLRERGFDCRLVYYVDRSVSPENALLVATRKQW